MSKTLKEMMSNGGYWFGQTIYDIYNFEYLFWDNLFPISYGMSEEKAIDLIFNSPEHQSAEEIIQRKLKENAEYMNKLQTLKVIYPPLNTELISHSSCDTDHLIVSRRCSKITWLRTL